MHKVRKLYKNLYLWLGWSDKELWYTTTKDGGKIYHIFDIGVIRRESDYTGLSIIILKLNISIVKCLF